MRHSTSTWLDAQEFRVYVSSRTLKKILGETCVRATAELCRCCSLDSQTRGTQGCKTWERSARSEEGDTRRSRCHLPACSDRWRRSASFLPSVPKSEPSRILSLAIASDLSVCPLLHSNGSRNESEAVQTNSLLIVLRLY